MSWTKRWRKRLRAVVRNEAVERELEEELAFHLEMETEKYLREGVSPAEARRRAVLAFGGVERHKEEVRAARFFGWWSGLSLDFKLGARMLKRYPGLTIVGGLAMAFAIGGGAASFEAVTQLVHPRLPLEEGSRIVGIRTLDAETGGTEQRVGADFRVWREEVRSLEDVGAFRLVGRNLLVPGGSAEPVGVAEMTASGFRLARVPPLLGRWLVEEDEAETAPPVVVLAYDVWRTRLRADRGAVGREVRLGGEVHTVVGVMPEGFGFPVAQGAWTPLRRSALEVGPREGLPLRVFGRLAPGASLAAAQAEVGALGRRAALDSPETHAHLRPNVTTYARSILDMPWRTVTGAAYGMNAGVLVFLLLVCANVATLVFARTASRERELVTRTALGASRQRIVLQLFAEALVLGGIAAAVGLAAAAVGLGVGKEVLDEVGGGELPFWFHGGLSARTVVYSVGLALVAAAVAGVVPALKMTGRHGESRLRQVASGGSTLRFGRFWTGIVVTQVAFTAAFLPIVLDAGLDTGEIQAADVGFPAREYLSARVELEEDADHAAVYAELERRLEAEPGVLGVSHAAALPGAYHRRRPIEVDGGAAAPADGQEHRIQTATVAPDFLALLGAPVVAGRGFQPGDTAAERRVVVVNESFVREVLGGRNAVGRRLGFRDPVDDDAPAAVTEWYEIVGVVRDVRLTVDPDLPHNAGIYRPAAPSGETYLRLAIHLRGDPAAFAPRLRALATDLDPTLRLYEIQPIQEAYRETLLTYQFWTRLAYAGCGVVLLLSVMGIHAILAFTVARRTREIGIRIALGADRRRVVSSIFSRAFRQVGLGVLAGLVLIVAVAGGIHSLKMVGVLAGGVALMVVGTAVACVVPARRLLGVEPTEAMRAEG